jgi:predicted TIM-barrel fold metal-dependent hydrolase
MAAMLDRVCSNPALSHVYFDLSWDEAAKYIVSSPETIAKTAALINNHPDRFLFGTDEVGPVNQEKYMNVYEVYKPLLDQLTLDAREKFLKGNYTRLFDEARKKVRTWESAHLKD